jgi:hypothetical protein
LSKTHQQALACAILSVLLAWRGAFAHHSFAMFDRSKEISLSGTVKDFKFVNPHSWIYLQVTDEHGNEQLWQLEGGSISALARNGWTSNSLKPGDKITVRIFRMRDGTPAGEFHGVTTADGRRLDFTPRY